MNRLIAALPMYDWPETRAEVDAEWATTRNRLRDVGIGAPENLCRRNADMPAVPGGIRDGEGQLLAPDPATLPPDELDLPTLWRHPNLLLAQTCWGPMEQGLAISVAVVGQPDYTAYAGGAGQLYSSVLLMRRDAGRGDVPPPADGSAVLPRERMRGVTLAYNGPDSMSGIIALTRDLEIAGQGNEIFSALVETGSHRASLVAVATGRADLCAVDCRTWDLARRFEPLAASVQPVGWTSLRMGLPFISARHREDMLPQLTRGLGCLPNLHR